MKNDNANGIIQFSRGNVEVKEPDKEGEGKTFVNIIRHAGAFGEVRKYIVLDFLFNLFFREAMVFTASSYTIKIKIEMVSLSYFQFLILDF